MNNYELREQNDNKSGNDFTNSFFKSIKFLDCYGQLLTKQRLIYAMENNR